MPFRGGGSKKRVELPLNCLLPRLTSLKMEKESQSQAEDVQDVRLP